MRFSAYSYTNISDVIENAVSSFHTEYYQSTSNTELIGGKWSTTIPPWENGKYYWQKTITTFSDPNKTPIETKPVCITGGIGSDGRGIKSIIPEYAKNTNGTTAPVSGWSSSRPTWNQGEYIWTRFKITYNDGSNPEYTTPTCDSSWEAMNNLEIGGRNLLKSTSSITGYKPDQRNWNWGNWGTVLTNTTDTATDSIHIVTPGGDIDINSGVSFYVNDIKYQKCENYTFSIAIRGTYNPTDKFVAHIWYETATSNKYDSSSTTSWIDNQDGINDGISSVIFQRRFISFTVPEDFDETKNKLRIVISCKKMDILLCRPQLEKGNKPTDWKRAEEDIQEQFTSVISSVSGVKSIVDKINGQITNKIWVTDINNTVNEYDNTKIKTIRDQVALQEQTLSGFKQTVKDMQTTIATKADGSTVETIKNNVSSLTQDLSGFKTTVESTYATNDNLKNNYFTKTETQQLADKIYWIVSDSSTSSSLTLTSQALTAMTNQFVVKSPDGKRVVIQKGQILLDALKSNNYSAPTSSTGIYAAAGTFYDLSNGSITSKNFVLDSNGNISLKGTVYATSGSFTGDIVANSLTLGSKVSISSNKITGLSTVATSGKYTDLTGTPSLDVYIQKDGTIGSTPGDGVTGFKVSSTGLLSASNAIIYGTIYATSGIIGGCQILGGKLIVPTANITGTLSADKIVVGSGNLTTNLDSIKNQITVAQNSANKAISLTQEEFYSSTSPTALSGGSWQTTQPAWKQGQYIWRRTKITYVDSSKNPTYEPSITGVCITGNTGATGSTGNAGKSVATVYLYQRKTSVPSKPTNALTFTFSTGVISGSINNGWSTTIPNGSNPLYVITAMTSSGSATDTIAASDWSSPVILSQNGATGAKGDTGTTLANGTSLYTDSYFANGTNGLSIYNNSSDTNVSITRQAKSSDNPYKEAKYEIMVKTIGTASPGLGGVVQRIDSRANAVFVRRVIAKIPTGYSIRQAENSMGTGYKIEWLTPRTGTGRFTEYIYRYTCGASGSFSNGGHMYIEGVAATSDKPVTWHIASCETYDMNAKSDIIKAQEKANEAATTILNWCWQNNQTYIDGKNIYTGTVTAKQLSADALKSNNYVASTDTYDNFAQSGTFYNLLDGSIISKNFLLDNNGNVSIKGVIEAKTGRISKCFINDDNIVFLNSLNVKDDIISAGFGDTNYAFFAGSNMGVTEENIKGEITNYIPDIDKKTTPLLITYDGKIYSSDLNIRNSMNIYDYISGDFIPFIQYTFYDMQYDNPLLFMGYLPDRYPNIDWDVATGICFNKRIHAVEVYGDINVVGTNGNVGDVNCNYLRANNVISVGQVKGSDIGGETNYFNFSKNANEITANKQVKAPDLYATNKVLANDGFQTGGCVDKFKNNILWGGGAIWPNASQTATFSQPVSKQPHGIVLVFRGYNSAVQNGDWHSFFISKHEVAGHGGQGHSFFLSHTPLSMLATKYIYVSDSKLTGHDNNSKSETTSDGITYRNNRYVLQYVLGV